ncbi:MAG: hypothetical protein J6R18_02320 [Kiritimatiellae bacterium]|nr:hypothetical protein [Kiritimatiellia bacterium]
MKNMTVKSGIALACVMLGACLHSIYAGIGGTNYWKGTSGRWHDPDMWNGGVPDKDTVASFPKSAEDYTVTVDSDAECKYLRIENGTSGGVVTFTGDAKLECRGKAAGPSVSSYASSGAKVKIASLEVFIEGFNPYNGEFTVDAADAKVQIDTLYFNGENSKFTVNAGDVHIGSFSIRTACSIAVNGGNVSLPEMNCNYNNGDKKVAYSQKGGVVVLRGVPKNFSQAVVDFAGGVLKWHGAFDAVAYKKWLPKNGAKLVLPYDSYIAFNTDRHANAVVEFDGCVYVTNNVEECNWDNPSNSTGVYAYTNTTFRGDGSLYANFVFVRGTCTVDIAKFALGDRLHFTNSKCVLLVPDGVEFGAYGSWSTAYQNAYSYFYGPITVDTSDCFDGVTPRTITFGRTSLDDGVEYKVKGTGTNVFWSSKIKPAIKSLTVYPNATFYFKGRHNQGYSEMTISSLSLGDNATLTLDATNACISAVEADIDPTATIRVNIPAGVEGGKLYQLLSNSSLVDVSDRIAFTGEGAEGWGAKSVAGAVYLTDGKHVSTPETPYTWVGSQSGFFSNGQNWYGESAPTGTGDESLRFDGSLQTVVTNDISATLEVSNIRFLPSAAPYEIHGNRITVKSPAFSTVDSSIVCESRFPVVFYAPVYRNNGKLGIVTTDRGYIQFMGDLAATNANLYVKGDIRIGGNATFKGICFRKFDTSSCSVTVLDGGKCYAKGNPSLTASDSADSPDATINVRSGGSFVVDDNWIVGDKVASLAYTVEGYFAVSNTFVTSRSAPFAGNGEVYFGGVSPTNRTGEISFDGNISLGMGGDWHTLSDIDSSKILTLSVKSGVLTLAADSDWTYGDRDIGDSDSTIADRAIKVGKGAVLKLAASDHTTTLCEPIYSDGSIVFEDGFKLSFAGRTRGEIGEWITFAVSPVIEGVPSVHESNYIRTVENPDGTVAMQSRRRAGSVVVIR